LKQLFKYLSEPRDIFSEGFIRLSQPSALNDPFEASFCRLSLDELAGHFDHSTAFDPDLGELSFSTYIENRMHHTGVISFSENKENLLMWAHYANEHKGLIVGIIDIPRIGSIFHNLLKPNSLVSSSFGEEWSPFDGEPKSVNYRKGLRYRNDKFDYDYSNISAEGADRILYEVFMQKSDEWIYEQEHRVVLRLEQADRVVVPNIEHVANTNIKKLITESPHTSIDLESGSCVVNLFKFADEIDRTIIAVELSKLSKNPDVIYLMKLASHSINSCLLGLNSSLKKSEILSEYNCSKGYFDVWKAKKNEDYYSLEFEEI
tara:strand:+ start:307 stop:1260 length:954 start_codon:yes stop_codon:yes gene_type:complete